MSPSTPVTIEELLTHARWLRLLVRRMLDDPATADDVVQQTYLSALRSPPRHRTGLRGWLATVLFSGNARWAGIGNAA